MTVLADRYTLIEQVGEGGMGVVWRARDGNLERDVAIKLLHSFVAKEPEQRRRFEREARTLARLANEHIVRVYDYADLGERAFLVMEYVNGGNLAQETIGRLPLALGDAAGYLAPVADGLAYAHAQGVVHRDLTPANILIERTSGRVVTTDFGLARAARSAGSVTAAGLLIGTPEYWSPEQAMGRETGPAGDVYALGCILFLLLTGRLPFAGEDRLAVGLRRVHEDAPSLRETLPGASAAAAALVDSLLAREPGLRPDAAAVASVLHELASSTQARPASVPPTAAASPLPTLVLAAEKPTLSVPTVTVAGRAGRRPRWGRLLVVFALTAAATTSALFLVADLRGPVLRVPAVVALREGVARSKILRLLPGSDVIVKRAYSAGTPVGRVISQRPRPRARVGHGVSVRLVVSRGTPFAAVPLVSTGAPPAAAKAALARRGFSGRYRYEASWTVRKGTVIELRPAVGERVRRPATVTILVASGYPRSVVPDVLSADLVSARTQLEANHLRYRITYRLAPKAMVNQVLRQWPAAGASVYQGTRVRLTVARTLHWVKVFADSGAGGYLSNSFSAPRRWRIRYRLEAGGLGLAFARFSWSDEGDLFGGNGFTASDSNSLRTYVVPDSGTYRLAVSPYAGTAWYVEVDALE